MANIKVSEMAEATVFDDGDYAMIIQANQNKKISKENMLGGIESDISDIETDIGDIESNIGDLTQLETTDKSNLVNAINEIEEFLNINNFQNITSGNISGGGTLNSIYVTVATNSDGSLAKIYGQVDIATHGKEGNVIIQTNLRPLTQLTIVGSMYRSIINDAYVRNNALITYTLNTDGTITMPYVYTVGANDVCRLTLFSCLIFIKSFGDNSLNQGGE